MEGRAKPRRPLCTDPFDDVGTYVVATRTSIEPDESGGINPVSSTASWLALQPMHRPPNLSSVAGALTILHTVDLMALDRYVACSGKAIVGKLFCAS